jgi:Inner membrane protein YgaP-like, transmembrane domain
MSSERIIRILAGSFVLISLALGAEASPLYVHWGFLLFTAFVGLNLLQSGFTRFCLPEILLRKTGVCPNEDARA